MDLIQEARKRGYRKGIAIKYFSHCIDYVEGDYFEVDEYGNLRAYAKPKEERKSFDDNRFDELYNSSDNKWVQIVKE